MAELVEATATNMLPVAELVEATDTTMPLPAISAGIKAAGQPKPGIHNALFAKNPKHDQITRNPAYFCQNPISIGKVHAILPQPFAAHYSSRIWSLHHRPLV
ncbi:MAG: hypothetical protein IM638_03855 [Bacteroidetes bacterium]|nr:hypothetical protein [Bacteroidota bacterium]